MQEDRSWGTVRRKLRAGVARLAQLDAQIARASQIDRLTPRRIGLVKMRERIAAEVSSLHEAHLALWKRVSSDLGPGDPPDHKETLGDLRLIPFKSVPGPPKPIDDPRKDPKEKEDEYEGDCRPQFGFINSDLDIEHTWTAMEDASLFVTYARTIDEYGGDHLVSCHRLTARDESGWFSASTTDWSKSRGQFRFPFPVFPCAGKVWWRMELRIGLDLCDNPTDSDDKGHYISWVELFLRRGTGSAPYDGSSEHPIRDPEISLNVAVGEVNGTATVSKETEASGEFDVEPDEANALWVANTHVLNLLDGIGIIEGDIDARCIFTFQPK